MPSQTIAKTDGLVVVLDIFVFCVLVYTKLQMYGNVGLNTLSFTYLEKVGLEALLGPSSEISV